MIPLSVPYLSGNEWKYIKDCLDTNWVSSVGSYVNLFEEKFSDFIKCRHSIVTVNGTSAIHLALMSLGIKPGDEVIVPSLTFISPVNAIRYVGATPVFCDALRDTYVMDTRLIEELITEKTRAILPVHIYGHPVDMDMVMEIADKYGLYVIEDATESLGSLYKGKHTGTIGHIGCFSFNGNKLITTGAGGMLVTNDQRLGEYAKYLSNQTKTVLPNGGFYHEEIGFNYRMPNIVAAMGVAQLENIEFHIDAKIRNALFYNELLSEVQGISIPVEKPGIRNINWLYSVVVEDSYGESRDELIKRLKENNIESRPFFMPVHSMPSYKEFRCSKLDTTNELGLKGLNLPSSVSLTKEEIKKICQVIKRG
ncbi:aminotransferase class I/II-fold pyridoxal phosphate-dependent enzyme [Acetivibrio cellulolyticus]|uniref:aminotransferase class I/II-fold pyridoxal phosphate-dependent enzyme n=1 Tax=Acetivibrio cellulolyticus TaxID=35830 RepID=UPI0001E2FB48|nr:aminotransferase class I/II-fold pyridoxal phosphate-dependent enzyme [Acetivibrio cellulolyticus]